MYFALTSKDFAYGVDVFWVNLAFAELAVHQLMWDATEHLTVTDLRLHEVCRVRGSLGDCLPRAKVDLS